MVQLLLQLNIHIKRVSTKRVNAKTFADRYGIYNDIAKNSSILRNRKIMFQDDDIMVNNKNSDKGYKAKKQLWEYLTSVDVPDDKIITDEIYNNNRPFYNVQ